MADITINESVATTTATIKDEFQNLINVTNDMGDGDLKTGYTLGNIDISKGPATNPEKLLQFSIGSAESQSLIAGLTDGVLKLNQAKKAMAQKIA